MDTQRHIQVSLVMTRTQQLGSIFDSYLYQSLSIFDKVGERQVWLRITVERVEGIQVERQKQGKQNCWDPDIGHEFPEREGGVDTYSNTQVSPSTTERPWLKEGLEVRAGFGALGWGRKKKPVGGREFYRAVQNCPWPAIQWYAWAWDQPDLSNPNEISKLVSVCSRNWLY